MSASIENHLKDIARELRTLNNTLNNSYRPKTDITSESLVQCRCPNCSSIFVAELPEGQKIVSE